MRERNTNDNKSNNLDKHEMAFNLMKIYNYSICDFFSEVINARDLHSFLEIDELFDAWISNRVKGNDFIIGSDFFVTNVDMDGNMEADAAFYFLTLNMAAALAVFESNEKGNQALRYLSAYENQRQRQMSFSKVM